MVAPASETLAGVVQVCQKLPCENRWPALFENREAGRRVERGNLGNCSGGGGEPPRYVNSKPLAVSNATRRLATSRLQTL